MSMNSGISINPVEAVETTRQLDELADRVERLMQAEAPGLTVIAPGRDEVSVRVATTLNEVHQDFDRAAGQGTLELREAAATLRAQTDGMVGVDEGISG
jgi:hypothetical protein